MRFDNKPAIIVEHYCHWRKKKKKKWLKIKKKEWKEERCHGENWSRDCQVGEGESRKERERQSLGIVISGGN